MAASQLRSGIAMTAQSQTTEFDVIVIGSGMGGMTTATALSRLNYRVLLLEQAQVRGAHHLVAWKRFARWSDHAEYALPKRNAERRQKLLTIMCLTFA